MQFKQFGAILTEVLEEELGTSFNAEAETAWKNGLAALLAGISKTLRLVYHIFVKAISLGTTKSYKKL